MAQIIEITKVSWISRFKNAILGLLFAPIFAVLGFLVLRYGEIEHAKTKTALKNIIHKVHNPVDAKNGELFWYSDSVLSPKALLNDKEFKLKVKAIKLYRKVYTWQWVEKAETKEKRENFGSKTKETTYTYNQDWVSHIIYSDHFKYKEGHTNPEFKKYDSLLIEQTSVKIGPYLLEEKLLNAVLNFRLFKIDSYLLISIKNAQLDTLSRAECPWYEIFPKSYDEATSGHSKEKTNSLFLGKGSPIQPQIGDTRIEYWYIPDDVYTLVGMKMENGVGTYKNDSLFVYSDLPCGGTLHSFRGNFGMIFSGKKELAEMFKILHNSNDKTFIIIRFLGLIFVVAGFALFGNPLGVLFGWLPFIGVVWEKAVFK